MIQQRIPVASSLRSSSSSTSAKKKDDDLVVVVDVGAGAGVSTALLWRKGYRNIRAVDWSDTAWQESVSQQQQAIPETVQFFAMDDEAFFQKQGQKEQKYDVIVYNFAINFEKAVSVARQHLVSSDNNNNQSSSLLLAPVNEKVDYWYKQRYVVLNSRGEVVWQSDDSIGAWSIQFQPDVTASSCTASIWCGPWNGYQPSPPQQQRRSNE